MEVSLGDLRKNKTELVLWRDCNIHKEGTVVVVTGELDDECGNVVSLKYRDSEERFEIPESIFWDYVEIKGDSNES